MVLCLVDIPQAMPIFAWCLHVTKIVHIITGLAIKKICMLERGQGQVCQKFVPTKHPCFKSSFTGRGSARAIPEITPLLSLPTNREAEVKP